MSLSLEFGRTLRDRDYEEYFQSRSIPEGIVAEITTEVFKPPAENTRIVQLRKAANFYECSLQKEMKCFVPSTTGFNPEVRRTHFVEFPSFLSHYNSEGSSLFWNQREWLRSIRLLGTAKEVRQMVETEVEKAIPVAVIANLISSYLDYLVDPPTPESSTNSQSTSEEPAQPANCSCTLL